VAAARCHETLPRSLDVLGKLDEDSDKIETLVEGHFAVPRRARPRLNLCVSTAGTVRPALKVILRPLDKAIKYLAICWGCERKRSSRAS
jgi:hypothetical protein